MCDERFTWKNKSVLIADYSGADEETCIEMLSKEKDILKQAKGKVSVLHDVTDADLGRGVVHAAKEAIMGERRHLKRVALVGLGGMTRLLLKASGTLDEVEHQFFDDKEKALAWLLKDA